MNQQPITVALYGIGPIGAEIAQVQRVFAPMFEARDADSG